MPAPSDQTAVASSSSSTAVPPNSDLTATEPQILLLGLRRSGKSSLLQVLYNHLPPNDTLFLESTLKPYAVKLDIWGSCNVWDGISIATVLQTQGQNGGLVCQGIPNLRWNSVKSIIWVLDAQDDYFSSLASLHSLIVLAFAHNPGIQFHVFLHKMDGLSEDYRDDTQTDIEKRIDDNLSDASSTFVFAQGANASPSGRSGKGSGKQSGNDGDSAIGPDGQEYDLANMDWDTLEQTATQAVPDAVIRPSQKQTASNISKSKGTSQPPDLETDVNLTIHQTSIFDSSIFVAFSRVLQPVIFPRNWMKAGIIRLVDSLVDVCQFEKLFLVHLPTRTFLVNDSSPFDKTSFDVVCDYLGFLVDFSTLFANLRPPTEKQLSSPKQDSEDQQHTTSYSYSTLCLNADNLIVFWQIDASLAVIAILRSTLYHRTSALLDANISVFRKAIAALLSTQHGKPVSKDQLEQM
ncbi:unnamed protein product [Sympodiomycopsis kandeliae]